MTAHPVESMTVAERNRYFDRKDREFRKFCRDLDRRADAARASGKNHVLSETYDICTRCRRTFHDLVVHEVIACEGAP